jgi:CheY-like chemotaxis protein
MTSPTILCADDDRQFSRIIDKALSGAGYRVICAHDGDEALEALRSGEVDLAMLDLWLPRLDGFSLLESLRRLPEPAASTPALLMSGTRPTSEASERAQRLAAAALLTKPIPLDDLLELVNRELKVEVSPAAGRQDGAESASRKAPKLAGSFKELPFPHLLHQLHGLRATGVLLLESGKKRKAIQLRDGYPVAAKSNLVNECLGNLLVRRGKLDTETLQESLRRVKRGEGLQGEILVAMQVLTEEEIPVALREQAEEKVREVFSWKAGRFRFEIGGRLKRGTSLALEGSPASLIVAGVRSAYPLSRIDRFFARHGKRSLMRAESPFNRFQDVELSPAEEAALSGLQGGPRPLSEFVHLDEPLRRTLYGLIVTGLLELRDADAAPASQADPEQSFSEGIATAPAMDPAAERVLRTDLAATAERLRRQDPFAALGVSDGAGEEEVLVAYEEQARRCHPDRFRGASSAVRQLADEVFQLLTNAHDLLTDPARREEYERAQQRDQRREREREADRSALEAEMEFQTGEARLRQRDYEGALACFGAALTGFPEEGEYHALYGWCLYLCNPDDTVMVQEAIEHVKRGVKLAHDREKPYLYLGRLYKVIGRGAAAEKMFTRALEISPECVEALRELRLINLRREKGKGFIGRLLRR